MCFNNFKKISTPILEHENIFLKTLGVTSDIISKEMYNFKDQGGDDLLRPEGTAAIVRALITNSLQEKLIKIFTIMDQCLEEKGLNRGGSDNFIKLDLKY